MPPAAASSATCTTAPSSAWSPSPWTCGPRRRPCRPAPATCQQLDRLAAGLDGVLEDLREIARGLHPAILADGGLRPALKTLARRSAVPVRLDIEVDGRLPEPVEIAAYYTVSEALTNAAKHARATAADVEVAASDGVLHVRVRDDGRRRGLQRLRPGRAQGPRRSPRRPPPAAQPARGGHHPGDRASHSGSRQPAAASWSCRPGRGCWPARL